MFCGFSFLVPEDKTCLPGIIGLIALSCKNTMEILWKFLWNIFLNFGNPSPTLCYCMKYTGNLHTIFPLFPSYGGLSQLNFFCQQVKTSIKHIFLFSVHDSLMPREGKEEKLSKLLFVLLGRTVSHEESAKVLFHGTAIFS